MGPGRAVDRRGGAHLRLPVPEGGRLPGGGPDRPRHDLGRGPVPPRRGGVEPGQLLAGAHRGAARLRTREAAVSNLASTAVANTLPGGAAIGIGVTATMQRSWGIPVSEMALASVVSGIWNNFLKLGLPIVALALLVATGGAGAGLVTAAAVGVLVLVLAVVGFALLLRSERLATSMGSLAARVASAAVRPLGRGPVLGWGESARGFRDHVTGLLSHRWARITVTTVVSHVSLFAVLLVALRNVGVSEDEVGWVTVLAAFAFIRLLSAVPVTPGGLGVVELGLTAALGSGLPEATKSQIAAAVLLFRALTWFAPIPLGIGCWVFWRLRGSWRRTIEERRAMPA
ncbi:MAG: UPF0104 family protein [Acidimicrobiia bacterium]|nr:UPF0104 family protein [Acidimicrobiia bacterium]